MKCENRHGRPIQPSSRVLLGRCVAALSVAIAAVAFLPGSAPAAAPPPAPTPMNTAAPSLTGTPIAGGTLRCSTGSWSGNPSSYAYAWLRDGVPIAGQGASSYVVQSSDRGHSLACEVTATNSGGEYSIGGLASGAYRVSFDDGEANYLTQYFSGQSSMWMATPVAVTAPAVTAHVDGALAVGGEISGTVTAMGSGIPLDHVYVCAEDREVGQGCAWTAANGQYTIEGLSSGSYLVTFAPPYVWRREHPVYLSQYFDGKATQEMADPVTVVAGSVMSGINAAMQLGGKVAGQVTAASGGAGIANVEVCAYAKGERAFEFTRCAVTDEAGEYTITGVVSGSYTIKFMPPSGSKSSDAQVGNYSAQYYSGKTRENEADPIAVTAGTTIAGIDASLQTGGQISGRATAATGGEPLAGIAVCAQQSEGDCTTTNASGEYVLSGLATGLYRIEFKSQEGGNYLTRTYNEKPSYPPEEFVSAMAGSTTSGIDVAMQSGGQISGVVTDAVTQKPLANVRVCATGRLLAGTCTRTAVNGQYTLSALETGTYNVEFRDFEEENHLALSKPNVQVAAGSTTSGLDVALPPGGQIVGRVIDASTGIGIANVSVCASEIGPGWESGGCVKTNSAGGSASASSNAIAVAMPSSVFTLARRASFDAKSGELDFFFKTGDPGTFTWSLFFKNADVGFADTLDISNGQDRMITSASAMRHQCRKGTIRRRRRCVRALVPFASGSQTVAGAGIIEVRVRPDAKAIKALHSGHTLQVGGSFTFQSSLGGSAVTRHESLEVHPARKHRGRHITRRS